MSCRKGSLTWRMGYEERTIVSVKELSLLYKSSLGLLFGDITRFQLGLYRLVLVSMPATVTTLSRPACVFFKALFALSCHWRVFVFIYCRGNSTATKLLPVHVSDSILQKKNIYIFDFKLLSCCECCMLSSG